MWTVIFAGGHRGAGRTALVANLAAIAADLGFRTLLLDTDNRGRGGGAAEWWRRRVENGAGRPLLRFDRSAPARLEGRLARAREEDVEYVLVDAQAAITRATAAMVAACDLALLPVWRCCARGCCCRRTAGRARKRSEKRRRCAGG